MKNIRFISDRKLLLRQMIAAWLILLTSIFVFTTLSLFLSIIISNKYHIILVSFTLTVPLIINTHIFLIKRDYHLYFPTKTETTDRANNLASDNKTEEVIKKTKNSVTRRLIIVYLLAITIIAVITLVMFSTMHLWLTPPNDSISTGNPPNSGDIGIPELLILLAILVILFGPTRIIRARKSLNEILQTNKEKPNEGENNHLSDRGQP